MWEVLESSKEAIKMCESSNFVIYFVIFLGVAFKIIYHIFSKMVFLTSNLSKTKIKRRKKKEKREEKGISLSKGLVF